MKMIVYSGKIDKTNQLNEAKRNDNHPLNMHLFGIVLTSSSVPMTRHTFIHTHAVIIYGVYVFVFVYMTVSMRVCV